MDWQEPIALAIVVLTSAVLLRRHLRQRRQRSANGSPCGGSCGCSMAKPRDSTGTGTDIVYHRR